MLRLTTSTPGQRLWRSEALATPCCRGGGAVSSGCAVRAQRALLKGVVQLRAEPRRNDRGDSSTPAVVVLGGGAAGLLAAITAGRRGHRVVVLEKNGVVGRKIRISGGGRCNFTNISVDLHRSFHSDDGLDNDEEGQFFREAFERYPPAKFIALVESHGIKFHEKKLGQLFCDRSAQQLVDMLKEESRVAGVDLQTQTEVASVSSAGEDSIPAPARFQIHCKRLGEDGEMLQEESFPAASVIVASGGLSYARTCGSTDLAHRVAADFGLEVTGIRPGLVPLVLPEEEGWVRGLSGLSLQVRASLGAESFVENLLFTHRGLSGPAVLQISSFWRNDASCRQAPLVIDLAPSEGEEQLRAWLEELQDRNPAQPVVQALRARLPGRFARAFWDAKAAPACGMPGSSRLQDLSSSALATLVQTLKHWEVPVAGTEGYPKAEVTCGGVATRELWPGTMEVRSCPGLYFVGEAVDVTGWLGGYNLQWAWSSGFLAGSHC